MERFFDTPARRIEVRGLPEGCEARFARESPEPGVELIHVEFDLAGRTEWPGLRLRWTHPMVGIQAHWAPLGMRSRGIDANWAQATHSALASGAPVACFHGFDGRNRHTWALSDARNRLNIHQGVEEETARIEFRLWLLGEPVGPLDRYAVTLRLDDRDLPWHRALADAAHWWEGRPDMVPAPVPETARLPMYSTWYSFHQRLDPGEVLAECAAAKAMGCGAVIVDDGWQTGDNARGYAHCGDWEAFAGKIPDMRAFVDGVHALGMGFLLWYSVPFVGEASRAYARFAGKYLRDGARWLGASVLDVRFPETREYLIGIYEQALRDWDLDGFKLDFVDSFKMGAEDAAKLGGGRDYDSLSAAVDRLMVDINARLRRIKPHILIEFRQDYVGPLMRKYGNMFRAGDCPNDALSNRVRTVDIRLLGGRTAAHSDMLMWHPDDAPEAAALQLLNILFSVPQISMRHAALPGSHREMAAFWLGFWREHRDVLLDGEFRPARPEANYSQVSAALPGKEVHACYSDPVVRAGARTPGTLLLVNATPDGRLLVDCDADLGERALVVRDCRGRVVREGRLRLAPGVHTLAVPASGLAILEA